MSVQTLTQARVDGDGVFDRRSFLRSSAALAAGGMLGFKDALTVHADQLRKQGMSCILVFLRGGPSQFETFDPKPDTTNGGPTKAIETAVNGVRVAEHWPTVAKAMKEICLVRSMNNREGEHQRATYQVQTGYAPAGGIKHPAFGALVCKEIAPRDFDLPHFVSVGGRSSSLTASFLGMRFSPYSVPNPGAMPANVTLPSGVGEGRLSRRIALSRDLEADFARDGRRIVEERQTLEDSAAQMVRSPKIKAFDLSQEREATRSKYGRSTVGQGCLLARRLVETGVTFVAIDSNGWDTHQENFDNVKRLSGTVDPGLGTLIEDLKERGMLDKTLVVCMGEFGRTPRINSNKGRDHWPRSFSALLAGGGIKGGRVVGSTTADGTSVRERPVGVSDLLVSLCHAMKIDPRRENLSTEGRPLKIVEGGSVVKELF